MNRKSEEMENNIQDLRSYEGTFIHHYTQFNTDTIQTSSF